MHFWNNKVHLNKESVSTWTLRRGAVPSQLSIAVRICTPVGKTVLVQYRHFLIIPLYVCPLYRKQHAIHKIKTELLRSQKHYTHTDTHTHTHIKIELIRSQTQHTTPQHTKPHTHTRARAHARSHAHTNTNKQTTTNLPPPTPIWNKQANKLVDNRIVAFLSNSFHK